MRRRVISIWLPHLAAERMLRGSATAVNQQQPFAATVAARGALRLCSLNRAAAAAGLTPGMALCDARAILPDLVSAPQAPERDAVFLRALARWSRRFSPLVGLEADQSGLMLDIAGCAHLFGGEAALLQKIETGLARLGLSAEAGLADTLGAAWALAHYGGAMRIAPPGETRRCIQGLPAAALRLEPEICAGLTRMGLRRIEDVLRAPRAALARRFGVPVLRRIDQALGAEIEPLSPLAPRAPFVARLSCPEPINGLEAVTAGLEHLLAQLCARLAHEGLGARRLRLTLRRADGGYDAAEIGLMRPGRDARMMARLFAEPMAALNAGFGVDALRLQALQVAPLGAIQIDMAGERQGAALDALLSTLANRIGPDALERLAPFESHIPERSWRRRPASHDGAANEWLAPPGPRPITLFAPEPLEAAKEEERAPPARFRWRRETYQRAAAHGPERIAPEWWRDDPEWRTGLRDYWRVETLCARRLWLFHTPRRPMEQARWFVQGVFA